MLQTEFVKNLNCNYERVLLDQKPEENRYQYCIVTRGGIRGLLPCSLRYINGLAYLYYDISSTQSVAQLYAGRCIKRQWMKDFLWGMRRIRQEMERFLLDDQNLLWYPEQVFQDLEKNEFYFLYIPYCEETGGFRELLDFLVEHIDYEDEVLVECVYKIHEQYELLGEIYLTEQIYEDGKKLDTPLAEIKNGESRRAGALTSQERKEAAAEDGRAMGALRAAEDKTNENIKGENRNEKAADQGEERETKRGIRYFFEGRLKKQKEEREQIHEQTGRAFAGYAVCEEDMVYAETSGKNAQDDAEQEEEELGRTVYLEENTEEENSCRLYSPEGKIVFQLNAQTIIIGKRKEEADCILEDVSVSRIHARITEEKDGYYLEDLNSTNGTCKNGLRLQPYEKRRLEKGDEIGLGKVTLIFR